MTAHQHYKPQPELPGFEIPVELTPERYIPDPGQVMSALWSVLPQLPTAPFEIVGALSELLPESWGTEAGG